MLSNSISNDAQKSDALGEDVPGWGVPLLLAAVIFCVYFLLSTSSTIWDRDEARFSRAAAEMVSTGNYLFPTFNGRLRPDKPVLIYWLMSVPLRLFGSAEWVYRLCAVCGTTLACLFTYSIGRSLFNHRVGLWGMAILAANPLLSYTGAVATSDAVLLAFITGAFAVFADSLKSELKLKHVIALAILFSGGMLTKGPAAILPIIPFIITRFVLRRELGNPLPAILKLLATVVFAGLMFVAWFYPANNATHGDLYDQMVLHHVVERIEKPLENHGGYSPFYLSFYFVVIVATFFPWTLYLPGALARLMKKDAQDSTVSRGRILLLAWIGTFLLVMIAISTKLPHYILPIWPALALSIGTCLDFATLSDGEDPKSAGAGWTIFGGALFLIMAVAMAAAIGFGPEYVAKYTKTPEPLWIPFANDSRASRAVIGALCMVIALPVIFRHKAAHFVSNAKTLLGAALVFFLLACFFLLPQFERVKISAELAKQINAHSPTNVPVTVCGYSEASLIFYLNRNVVDIVPERTAAQQAADKKNPPKPDPQAASQKVGQALSDWAKAPGPGVLVIPKSMYDKYNATIGSADLKQIGEVIGFNYSKGHWVDVLALRRKN